MTRRSQLRERILLVGAIPRPIGGVSNHVWRLGLRLASLGCGIVDMHPREVKYETPGVSYRVAPASRLLRMPWIYGELMSSPAEVLHFHFSEIRRVLWFHRAIVKGWRRRRTVVTLHHGDQRGCLAAVPRGLRSPVLSALRSFDRVVALSHEQAKFYTRDAGVMPNRLRMASSFIGLPDGVLRQATAPARLRQLRARAEVLVVASGYPASYYRHEDAIRVVKRLRKALDAWLVLCIYGKADSPEYEERLRRDAESHDFVILEQNLDALEFIGLLRLADLYVRPTTVDSSGIAVADSITQGVPVVASDVCERHPGTLVFATGDYKAFEAVVLGAVADLASQKRALASRRTVDCLPALLRCYGPGFVGHFETAERSLRTI